MEQLAAYTLRPVQETDEALLLELYSSTRAEEMTFVPWDAAQKQAFLQMQFSAQQKHYRAYFPHATHEMILAERQPIGRLYVDRREIDIRILDVTLIPKARGGGIGAQILLDLMKEAEQGNQSCSIYIESFNRSLSLFQRLGFMKTEENGAMWLLEWRAGS
jgi:RimJ/RimL family protein N-acetyltransferase